MDRYNTGEKPTIILYAYINRHAGTPDKNKSKSFKYIILYINSAIDLYTVKAYSLEYKECYNNVIVVDSHFQRIVLATEETTVTQLASHRPIKC